MVAVAGMPKRFLIEQTAMIRTLEVEVCVAPDGYGVFVPENWNVTKWLSPAATSVWGKSDRSGGDGWLSLWRHLADTSTVAGMLWDAWLPGATRARIAQALPGGDADARVLVCWLAGLHDVGKATPAFAVKHLGLAERMRSRGLAWKSTVPGRSAEAPHATAGQVIMEHWLRDACGWRQNNARQIAIVVGGHHGTPPTAKQLNDVSGRFDLLGWDDSENRWSAVHTEIIEWMTAAVGAKERLADWERAALSPPVQALVTAVVILADWIASNERYFPYVGHGPGDRDRATHAWRRLRLPAPWSAPSSAARRDDLLQARFARRHTRPVQQAAIDAARQMPAPGIMIVEAPMGEGKTEAALAAVEILSARFGCGGCYIALPTRATSDAMFARFVEWLARIEDTDPDRGAFDVSLAHGKARLDPAYRQLLHAGFTGVGDTSDNDLIAHMWLSGRRKALLASFAVGTIDQLLMSALKSRYVALRHLGLAGKVVVIDEAHAYDVYMNQYLGRAVEWLGAMGVPVIVLSATLPSERRKSLVEAYGRSKSGPISQARGAGFGQKADNSDPYARLDGDIGYPAVVCSQRGGTPSVTPVDASGRELPVVVTRLDDDPASLERLLREKLVDGGCALVVRNTVRRAQATAYQLRRALPDIPVTMAHSRYMAFDRSRKDEWLRDTFGPDAGPNRPHSHIVVSTQVVEQSLDVDFDLLITDLAPVDLILQRIGRMHRHPRRRPAQLRRAECHVAGADWAQSPPQPGPGSTAVYDAYQLLRSAAALWPQLHQGMPLRLPDDIAPLVQTAYGHDEIGPTEWRESIMAARGEWRKKTADKERQAEIFRLDAPGNDGSLLGWLDGGVGDVDVDAEAEQQGVAQVRDTADSIEVIMLTSQDGRLSTPAWLDEGRGGRELPTEMPPEEQTAEIAAGCTITLPRDVDVETAIRELEDRHDYPAWQGVHWLKGQLVLDFDSSGSAEVAGVSLRYAPHDGLRVCSRKTSE